jgi:hypothetical protein
VAARVLVPGSWTRLLPRWPKYDDGLWIDAPTINAIFTQPLAVVGKGWCLRRALLFGGGGGRDRPGSSLARHVAGNGWGVVDGRDRRGGKAPR